MQQLQPVKAFSTCSAYDAAPAMAKLSVAEVAPGQHYREVCHSSHDTQQD